MSVEQIPSLQGYMCTYTCWNIPDSSQCGLEDREMMETERVVNSLPSIQYSHCMQRREKFSFSLLILAFLAEVLKIRLPKDKQ